MPHTIHATVKTKVSKPKAAPVQPEPETPVPEPETIDFAEDLAAKCKKAWRPVFNKKLQALKDEYFGVVVDVDDSFRKNLRELEDRYAAIRAKNEKEFVEKVAILKKTYRM